MKDLNFKNIKGGPKSTLLGGLLIAFSLYMFYSNTTETYDYIVNGGIFTTGISLFFISDRRDDRESTD